MDFFEAQEQARKRSRTLVGLFAAAVVSMIAVVYLVTLFTLGMFGAAPAGDGVIQPGLLAVVALGMLVLIGSGTAMRTRQLRRGGPAVAELMGGRRVRPDTSDPAERRLWNVVEEMSVAAGIPVPAVYVMDRESGINAFAAGHTIHDAAVAITRGGLDSLTRDEIQGVMAHEFSHILNGDMRLNLRLVGLLFGILLLTVVGRGLVHGGAGARRGRGRSGSQVALVGVALIVLGYLGVFFGRLIQAAVSRQREFLADAAAVQFTRNPAGIAGALRRIGGAAGSGVEDPHAEEMGHLFFARGVRGGFSGLFATHPPLEERIRRVEGAPDPKREGGKVGRGGSAKGGTAPLAPAVPGKAPVRGGPPPPPPPGPAPPPPGGGRTRRSPSIPGVRAAVPPPGSGDPGASPKPAGPGSGVGDTDAPAPPTSSDPTSSGSSGARASDAPSADVPPSGAPASGAGVRPHTTSASAWGRPASAGGGSRDATSGPRALLRGAAMMRSTGRPQPIHLEHARAFLDGLPEGLRDALHDPDGAAGVILALVLSEDEEVLTRQRGILAQVVVEEALAGIEALREPLRELGPEGRLPLLELAVPALREIPPEDAILFQTTVSRLIRSDGRVRPFEFALFHMVRRQLAGAGSAPPPPRLAPPSLSGVRHEVEVVLSALARAGASEERLVRAAFATGIRKLPGPGGDWRLQPAEAVGLERVDSALGRLETAAPQARKTFLEAAIATVQADSRVDTMELEMLRAVAEALDVPIPPRTEGGNTPPD